MLPPGSPAPALWQTYRFVTKPKEYMRQIQQEYGDAVRVRSLMGQGVAVFEAGLAREVFAAPPETFEAVPMVESLFGSRAVIAVSGDRHRKLRKLLNPHFHGGQVKGFLTAMQRAVRMSFEHFSQAAGTGRAVVMADLSQSMALDVILETVFGAGDLDRHAARSVLVEVVQGFTPAILGGRTFHKAWFPPWRRFVRAREVFDRWAEGVILARRAGSDRGEDVLGVLLSSRYEDGSPMDDDDVRDQLFTLLLAGHETSAIATAWCVHYLLQHPSVLARLRGELDALGDDPLPDAVTRLPYLDSVISETLRIEPIVTDVVRVCREPFTLGERWTVPKGGLIAVMLGSILRDPRVFAQPEQFRPERFLEKKFTASEFVPFGGGARRCLGAAFAEAELALAVAHVATHWELSLERDAPERAVRRNITMGPQHGVPVKVHGRRERAAAPQTVS
jgi:cytochrome P450